LPSAFISYAHEDQEYVLALVPHLQAAGLDVRYDRVALHIGDSLIRAISKEIAEGDFLIAIVSPASVESEWCQTELALAKTQGINKRGIMVLPVKYGEAEMPPMLADTFWGDADQHDVATIARQLGAAMTAHMRGAGDEASAEAAEAVPPTARPQRSGNGRAEATVGQIEQVADKVWDLIAEWERVLGGASNVRDLNDEQRRLRWALNTLPEVLQLALPLVTRLSRATWDEYFGAVRPDEVEPDLQEELRSVRAQVEQGLPITRRWRLGRDFGNVSAGRRDAVAHAWEIVRGDQSRLVTVYISGTAMASENQHLPQEVARAKETDGRTVVADLVSLDDPPEEVSVTTAGVSLAMPD